ncbi:hypothetical protein PYCC9005_000023 [Savitreella phatthalungensis]
MSRVIVNIDIVSDTICPWCFIGKRRLERAIRLFDQSADNRDVVNWQIRWHPFYLGPPEGPIVNKLQRYREKFGEERTAAIVPHMQQVGQVEGIRFSYGGVTGPTYLSHRLIDYVQQNEPASVVDAVIEKLFHRYFEAEGSIFTVDDLLEAIEGAGVKDAAQARSFMEAPEGRSQVDAEVARAQSQGVHGVPDITIGRFHVNGAQEPETLLHFLKRAATEATSRSEL